MDFLGISDNRTEEVVRGRERDGWKVCGRMTQVMAECQSSVVWGGGSGKKGPEGKRERRRAV